jgi:hypothetical protein
MSQGGSRTPDGTCIFRIVTKDLILLFQRILVTMASFCVLLAIPFFRTGSSDMPFVTAYMPRSQIKSNARGYRCEPAAFKHGKPCPRPGYQKFFGAEGLKLLEEPDWGRPPEA